ncbi:hypothetical protein BDDG_13214, partial [Blastomyces dermatitidis ATCC 18188]
SSCVDRFIFTDNSELNLESLIKNLKNVIIKKLSVSYITESLTFLSVSSVSFSAALSQSSISVSVSDSPASAISVPVTLTLTTSALSGFTVSAFIISSSHFKKMLYRLDKSHFSRITSLLNSIEIINICVFRNRNMNVILFYTYRCEAFTSASEIILIKDNNITETILFYSYASSVTFSSFSVRKIVYSLNY